MSQFRVRNAVSPLRRRLPQELPVALPPVDAVVADLRPEEPVHCLRPVTLAATAAEFVAAFPGNLDFVNAEFGKPSGAVSAPKGGTYGALTVGATIKPPMPAAFTGLLIRPELRYDSSMNGVKAFSGKKDALTLATDFVLTF